MVGKKWRKKNWLNDYKTNFAFSVLFPSPICTWLRFFFVVNFRHLEIRRYSVSIDELNKSFILSFSTWYRFSLSVSWMLTVHCSNTFFTFSYPDPQPFYGLVSYVGVRFLLVCSLFCYSSRITLSCSSVFNCQLKYSDCIITVASFTRVYDLSRVWPDKWMRIFLPKVLNSQRVSVLVYEVCSI